MPENINPSPPTAFPANNDGPDKILFSLPSSLLRGREAVLSRLRTTLREHDITEQQWRILTALSSAISSIRPSELSQLTSLSMPNLSRRLKTLESRLLIERAADERDLRATQINITPMGQSLVEKITPHWKENYKNIELSLGKEDAHVLYNLLEDLAKKLGSPTASETD